VSNVRENRGTTVPPKKGTGDSLSVREWLRFYTDREPPLPTELLARPGNRVSRAVLRRAVEWLYSIGVVP